MNSRGQFPVAMIFLGLLFLILGLVVYLQISPERSALPQVAHEIPQDRGIQSLEAQDTMATSRSVTSHLATVAVLSRASAPGSNKGSLKNRDAKHTSKVKCALSGRVILKNGDPLPQGLTLAFLPKKPPFSFMPFNERGAHDSLCFAHGDELLASELTPGVLLDKEGTFRIRETWEEAHYPMAVHPFFHIINPPPLRPSKDESKTAQKVLILAPCGVVEGRVYKPDGTPAHEAQVTLGEPTNPYMIYGERKGTYASFTMSTSPDGGYRFEQVPPALPLTLTLSMKGFAPVHKNHVKARAARTMRIDLQLIPAASIQGVVAMGSGQPLADARVMLYKSRMSVRESLNPGFKETMTDGEGLFRFGDLTPGHYQVRALHAGYIRESARGITLVQGQNHDEVRLILREGLTISGTVSMVKGDPVPAAEVKAAMILDFSRMDDYILDQTHPITAKTDEAGRFTLSGLEKGWYNLECGGDSYFPVEKKVAGNTGDCRFILEKGGAVSGIVISSEKGAPVEQYTLIQEYITERKKNLFNPRGLRNKRIHDIQDPQGKFLIQNLVPGEYEITFKARGFGTGKTDRLTVKSGEEARGIIVSLPAESSVSGKVLDRITGAPIENALISSKSGLEGTMRRLAGEEEAVLSDALGAFRVGGLAEGPVKLAATHPHYMEAPIEEIDLQENESASDVVIFMSRGGGIEGFVRKPDQIPIAGVHIILKDMIGSKIKSALTDEEGNYAINGLPRGSYNVTRMPLNLAFENQGFTGSWLDGLQIQMIRVEENRVHRCDFVAGADQAAGTLVVGRVTEEGQPITKSVLTLFPVHPLSRVLMPKTTSSDGAGIFRFTGVAPGQYTLRLLKTEDLSMGVSCEVMFQVDVPDLVEYHCRYELPMGRIAGRVIDGQAGTALKNIRIVLQQTDPAGIQDSLSRASGNSIAEVYTDEEGRFTISNLRAGRFRVRGGGGDPFRTDQAAHGIAIIDSIALGENEIREDLSLELVWGERLQGRVKDLLGRPLSGASLYLRLPGLQEFESFSECITNGNGDFCYPGLGPGSYGLMVKHPEFALKTLSPVRIGRDEARTLDITLEPGAAVYVRLIEEKTGKAIQKAGLALLDPEGVNVYGHNSFLELMDSYYGDLEKEEKGLYLGRFSPGIYTLQVTLPDGRKKSKKIHIQPEEELRIFSLPL